MPLKQSRLLAPFEEYFLWRNDFELYTNFCVTAQFTETLTPKLIFHALSLMVGKFLQLSVDAFPIESNQKKYQLKFISHYKLSDVLEIINDENKKLSDILDEVDTVHFKYSLDKPLWKIILVNNTQIAFYCEHLLFDGNSGFNFQREFQKALNDPKETSAYIGPDSVLFDFTESCSSLEMNPKPTDITNYSSTLSAFIYAVFTELFPDFIAKLVQYYFSGNKYEALLSNKVLKPELDHDEGDNKNSNRLSMICITKEDSTKLINLCREHDVKLTSLLTYFSLDAILPITGEYDTHTCIPSNARSLIDMKKAKHICPSFQPEFGLHIGNFDLVMPSLHKIQKDDGKINWYIVKHIHEEIHKSVPCGLYTFGFLKFVDNKKFIEEQKSDPTKVHSSTLCVSNLGYLGPGKGKINIINSWFDQNIASDLFVVDIIGSESGLTICLRSCNSGWLHLFRKGLDDWISRSV